MPIELTLVPSEDKDPISAEIERHLLDSLAEIECAGPE